MVGVHGSEEAERVRVGVDYPAVSCDEVITGASRPTSNLTFVLVNDGALGLALGTETHTGVEGKLLYLDEGVLRVVLPAPPRHSVCGATPGGLLVLGNPCQQELHDGHAEILPRVLRASASFCASDTR